MRKIQILAKTETAASPLDLFLGLGNGQVTKDGEGGIHIPETLTGEVQTLDFASWLPFAAKEFKISPNATDYVLVPVIAIISDIPNRNGVAFPLSALKAWNRERGCIAYQTFKGQPVHIEHASDDPTSAIGIIVDTTLRQLKGFGGGKIWKLMLLLAIDKTNPHPYVGKILRGEINTYSMGAYVQAYTCGYCGAVAGQCRHIDLSRPKDLYALNGKLVFREVHGVSGYETSAVFDPAYVSALSDTKLFLK